MTPIFQLRREKATTWTVPTPPTPPHPTSLPACSCLVAAHACSERQVTDTHSEVALQATRPQCGRPKSTPDWEGGGKKASGWAWRGHVFGECVHFNRWETWKEVENYCKLALVDSDETELRGCLLQTGREGGGNK